MLVPTVSMTIESAKIVVTNCPQRRLLRLPLAA
jgi:hypothetical protein